MNKKDIVVFLGAVSLLVSSVYISYTCYDTVLSEAPMSFIKKDVSMISVEADVLRDYTTELLRSDRVLSEFNNVMNRDPFARYQKVVPKPKEAKKTIVIDLPEPKVEAKAPEPEPIPEVVETYLYRGTMVLAGKKKYVIERESDRKTYFVNDGDKTKDFIVLETTPKQVVITDYEEKITILKLIK